jgi:hypothetical protein
VRVYMYRKLGSMMSFVYPRKTEYGVEILSEINKCSLSAKQHKIWLDGEYEKWNDLRCRSGELSPSSLPEILTYNKEAVRVLEEAWLGFAKVNREYRKYVEGKEVEISMV